MRNNVSIEVIDLLHQREAEFIRVWECEQKIKEMSQAELEKLLAGAVESEDFELASKIHDEMERRKN